MVEWCAGYGGIHLGLKRAIPNLRVIAYGEIEAFACANLVAKMEAGLMDAAPIWTDIKTFPCEEFRDRVDILVAGYPCQPFSAAGKRLGTEDPRHLWPHIARAIRVIQPRLCFFENVEGHISLGLREVVGELESIGYKTAWGIFSASEVGAPHQRKRVFILGMANGAGERVQRCWAGRLQEPRPYAGQGLPLRGGDAGSCLAYPVRDGSGEGGQVQQGTNGTELVGNGESWGAYELADSTDIRHEWCGITGSSSAPNATTRCRDWVWPSRPGEPQHGWEPPRVTTGLANAGSLGRRGWNHGDAGGGSGEIQAAGSCGTRIEAKLGDSAQLLRDGSDNISGVCERSEEVSKFGDSSWTTELGDSSQREDLGREPRDMGTETSQGRCGDHAAGDAGEGVGDSKRICIPTTREHGAMGEAGKIPAAGEGCEFAQANPESSASRKRESGGANASEFSEIKCEMGGGTYESSPWMDLSKLSGLRDQELAEIREWMFKSDNRTDELRLLGNGVVPATAERAFRVLMEEIIK